MLLRAIEACRAIGCDQMTRCRLAAKACVVPFLDDPPFEDSVAPECTASPLWLVPAPFRRRLNFSQLSHPCIAPLIQITRIVIMVMIV